MFTGNLWQFYLSPAYLLVQLSQSPLELQPVLLAHHLQFVQALLAPVQTPDLFAAPHIQGNGLNQCELNAAYGLKRNLNYERHDPVTNAVRDSLHEKY